MKNFPWYEFYVRFVIRYEEFVFYYSDKKIDISTGGYKGQVYLSYGNEKEGFILKDYASPTEFLNDKIFDNKTIQEIWEDLN